MKLLHYFVLGALALSLGACSKTQPTSAAEVPVSAEATQAVTQTTEDTVTCEGLKTDKVATATDWADANNAFALKMLAASKGTTVASAFSAERALGMILEGACGQTAKEMRSALALPEADGLSKAGAEVEAKLLGEFADTVTVSVDNRVWIDKKFSVTDAYAQNIKQNYHAEQVPVDFMNAPDDARQTINAHVAQATHDKIKDILPSGSVGGDTRMVLTNAIYFKAPWANPFKADATQKEDFSVATGKIQVDMMHQVKDFRHFSGDTFDAALLEFTGSPYGMLIILPKVSADGDVTKALYDVESSLTAESLRALIGKLEEKQVDLKLPKFRIEADVKLKDLLVGAGMKLAFTDDADFTGISGGRDLKVSDVFHKAYIDVNEDGAEAAAATAGVMMMRMSIRPPQAEPVVFHADHPFVFSIVERQTGAALFMGRKID